MAEQQDFWQRPEGKFGRWLNWGLIAGAAALAFFFWGSIVPFVVSTLAYSWSAALYAVGLAAIVGFFVEGSGPRLLANLYKRAVRALYILSFNVDPIQGLRVRIQELRERNAYARQEAAKVKGESQKVQATIDANDQEREQNLKLMATAEAQAAKLADPVEQRQMKDRAKGASIKAGFAGDANKQLYPLKQRMDKSFAVLQDIISKSDLQVDVLESVVKVKTRTYQATKAGRNALKAALAAFRGDTAKDDMFQMNLEYIDDFASQAVGEMDALLDLNRNALDSVNLQQQSYSDEAWAELERRQQSVQHLLTESDAAQKLLSGTVTGTAPEIGVINAAPQAQADFGRLFNRSE